MREEILKQLVGYRSLTTNQIFSLLQMKGYSQTLRHVQADLATMKLAGMIESFPILPKAGSTSQYGWMLLRKGAKWVGLELEYGNHYRRKPSPDRIEYIGLKILLEQAVSNLSGWGLERPQTYGRTQPLPDRTPQHWRLAECLSWKDFFASGRWPAGGSRGAHTLGTPLQANDYVAYTRPRPVPVPATTSPGNSLKVQVREAVEGEKYSEQAVVFILCPPNASDKFWQARILEYQAIAAKLLVVGVFEDEEKALSYKKLLLKGGLRVTTLNRVRTVLEEIWKP